MYLVNNSPIKSDLFEHLLIISFQYFKVLVLHLKKSYN